MNFLSTKSNSVPAVLPADAVARELKKRIIQTVNSRFANSFRDSPALNNDILQLSNWIASDNRPWLVISSKYGNGKTTALRALASLAFDCHVRMSLFSAKQIAQAASDRDDARFLATLPVLGIDDLGFEPDTLRSFGNSSSPVIDLLERRYDLFLPTIITTNLSGRMLLEHYGEHLFDRLSDLALFLPFTQSPRRPYGSSLQTD